MNAARSPESGEPDSASQLAAEQDPDLRASLAGLSQLAAGQVPLPQALTHVAEFAVSAIVGADGAGLTLLQDGVPQTVVTTAEFVRQVEDIQYGLSEGPCVTAAEDRRTVLSGSLDGDRRWPRFGPRVAKLRVHSALSFPLLVGDETVAAVNIYARAKDAFDERAVQLAELFAGPAAASVHDARALLEARTLAAQLQSALKGRAVIDQAIGILMSRSGCAEEEAFDRLRATSRSRSLPVPFIAQQIVTDAVHRARTRPTQGG
jgi:GAF domain-containing protein